MPTRRIAFDDSYSVMQFAKISVSDGIDPTTGCQAFVDLRSVAGD